MKIQRTDPNDNYIDGAIVLTVLCIILLKIMGVIKTPWVWLLSPVWILGGIGIILIVGSTIYIAIHKYMRKRRTKNAKH